MMGRVLIPIIFILVPLMSYGQKKERLDSLLRNERTMDRPLVTHHGQMRVSLEYTFSTFNSRYDQNGDKIKLAEQGSAGVVNRGELSLQYGILEFLQFSTVLGYETTTLREQLINILTLDPASFQPLPPINIQETRYISGAEDLYVGLDFMIPWDNRKLDIVFSGGLTLPLSDANPAQPQMFFYSTGSSLEYELYYYDKLSSGTVGTVLGGQIKYRFKDLAISGLFSMRSPTGTSESISWQQQSLGTSTFQFQSSPFNFQSPSQYFGRFQLEYQLYPFINLFMDYDLSGESGGWTEETGKKVAFRDVQLHRLNPGIEILLTPKFWLRQRFQIPVSGQNSFAPVGFETRLLYNFFAF